MDSVWRPRLLSPLHSVPGLVLRHPAASCVQPPITLSNTSHKLLVKSVNTALERVAELVAHLAQHGFMPGRGMLANVFEALSTMHIYQLLEGSVPLAILFDTRSAFPSVPWVITALQHLYDGSHSEVVFAGEVSSHGIFALS